MKNGTFKMSISRWLLQLQYFLYHTNPFISFVSRHSTTRIHSLDIGSRKLPFWQNVTYFPGHRAPSRSIDRRRIMGISMEYRVPSAHTVTRILISKLIASTRRSTGRLVTRVAHNMCTIKKRKGRTNERADGIHIPTLGPPRLQPPCAILYSDV